MNVYVGFQNSIICWVCFKKDNILPLKLWLSYSGCNMSNTKDHAWPHFQTPRRELKIWCAAEYFWQTLRWQNFINLKYLHNSIDWTGFLTKPTIDAFCHVNVIACSSTTAISSRLCLNGNCLSIQENKLNFDICTVECCSIKH